MTTELCPAHAQLAATVEGLFVELRAMRVENRTDIAALREGMQSIDRSNAQIKGHLGINGGVPHPHRRDSESDEHLHRRTEDVLAAAEAMIEANRAGASGPKEGTVTLPRWFVWIALAVGVVLLVLAAYAGPRGVERAVQVAPQVVGP